MHPKNLDKLAARVAQAAWPALAKQGYVSSIDVLVGMGWLDRAALERWRGGQIPYLERVVQCNLSRISKAMKLFRAWAREQGLSPSETVYRRRSHRLRFSKSGHPNVEQLYRTHWVSPALKEKKRERQAEKARRAAEREAQKAARAAESDMNEPATTGNARSGRRPAIFEDWEPEAVELVDKEIPF